MTICECYVGDLGDPTFSWDAGNWESNSPAQITQDFPPQRQHYNAAFHAFAKEHQLELKQTDYGCWVAKASRVQIQVFLASTYAGCEDLPWVKDTLPEILKQVAALDTEKLYALVAREF